MNTTNNETESPWRSLEPGELLHAGIMYRDGVYYTRRPPPVPATQDSAPAAPDPVSTKWLWMTDWCKKRGLPPADADVWNRAAEAWRKDSAPAAPSDPYIGGKSTWRVKIDDGFVEYEYTIHSPNGNHSIYELYLAICETLEARPDLTEGNFIRYTGQMGQQSDAPLPQVPFATPEPGEGAGGGDQPSGPVTPEVSDQYEWVCQKCGQRGVPATHVTYQETHDFGDCGGDCVAERIVGGGDQQTAREWATKQWADWNCGGGGSIMQDTIMPLADRVDRVEAEQKRASKAAHESWLLWKQVETERDEAWAERDDLRAQLLRADSEILSLRNQSEIHGIELADARSEAHALRVTEANLRTERDRLREALELIQANDQTVATASEGHPQT